MNNDTLSVGVTGQYMPITSVDSIRYLCKQYKIWPSRTSGQNFLVSEDTLGRTIHAAGLKPTDTVLEIGAGFGTLTAELAPLVRRVVTVELDRRLMPPLQKLAKTFRNITVISGDIFKQWPTVAKELQDLDYRLVANLPYSITSHVLRNFLERRPRPRDMLVMVQREVAERVTASAGQMSILSVAVQFYAEPAIVAEVPRSDFWPVPAVDSALLAIKKIGTDSASYQQALGQLPVGKFFSIVKIGFSARRKQLHNTLAGGLRLPRPDVAAAMISVGLSPAIRPQELTINQWISLAKLLQ